MTYPPCVESPDLFFPTGWADTVEAVLLCRRCPLRTACLDEALKYEGYVSAAYRFGVWGGMSPQQRADLMARSVAC